MANKAIQDITGNFTELNAALLQDTAERVSSLQEGAQSYTPTKLGAGIDFTQGFYNPVDSIISRRNNILSDQNTFNPEEGDDPAFAAFHDVNSRYTNASVAGQLTAAHKFDVTDQIKAKYIDQDLGYLSSVDNEDRYAQEDSDNNWFYNKGKHFSQFVGRTLPSTAYKMVDMLAATGSTIIKAPYALSMAYLEPETSINFGDNAISEYFSQLDTKVKDEVMPVYQSLTNRDQGFWYRAINDTTFYTQDLSDGVAFMGAAFLTAGLTEGVGITGAGSLSSKIGSGVAKLLSRGRTAAGLNMGGVLSATEIEALAANYVKNGQRFAKFADHSTTTILNTLGEASMEARDSYNKVKDELIEQGYSVDEAEKKAHAAYKGVFGTNMVILGLSNGLFETGLIRGTLNKVANRSAIRAEAEGATNMVLDRATGRFHQRNMEYRMFGPEGATTKGQKVFAKILDGRTGYYGSRLGKGFLAEGAWEENMQLAAQRYFEEADNLEEYNSGLLSTITGVAANGGKQLWNSAFGSDTEAGNAIGMGGLISAFGIGANTAVNKVKTGQGAFSTQQSATEKALNIYNTVTNQTFGDLYKQDDNGKYVKDSNGELQIDDTKMASFLKDHATRIEHIRMADATQNDTAKRFATKAFFGNFITQFLDSGVDPTKVLNFKLDQYRKGGDDVIKKLGFKDLGEFEQFATELNDMSNNIKAANESIKNDVKFSDRPEDNAKETARRNTLIQAVIRENIYNQEYNHFQIQLNEVASKVNTNPVVDQINDVIRRRESNKFFLNQSNIRPTTRQAATKLDQELSKQYDDIFKDNIELLKDFKKNDKGIFEQQDEQNIYRERYDKLKDSVAQARNLITLENKKFYDFANSKTGSQNFQQELDRMQQEMQAGADEANATDPATATTTDEIDPNAKRTKISTTDAAGKKYEHELIEGESYLTDKNPENRMYNGRPVSVFNHDHFKVNSINDDGTVTVTLNNAGEQVTLDPSELSNLGNIWSLRSMSPLLRIYFKNRDKVIGLNVGVFTKRNGQKFTKFHQLDNKDYTKTVSRNVEVKARLALRKDEKGANNVVLVYRDPFTGKDVVHNYNEDYLKKYGLGAFDLRTASTSVENQALEEQAKRLEAKRQTQLIYLNKLMDDASKQIESEKQRAQQNEQSVRKFEQKVRNYKSDLEVLLEIQQEILDDKTGKIPAIELEKVKANISSIEDDIAEGEKIIKALQDEKVDIQRQLQIHEGALNFYFEYGLEVETTGQPVDLSGEAMAAEEGYLTTLQGEDNRNSEDRLRSLVDATNEDMSVINGRIKEMQDLIKDLNNLLSTYKITEKFINAFNRKGSNAEILSTIKSLIAEVEARPTSEANPVEAKEKQDDIYQLRRILAIANGDMEMLRTLAAVRSRIGEANRNIEKSLAQLQALNEKKDRLLYAIGVKGEITAQTQKIAAYKELQAQFMQIHQQELIAKKAEVEKNTDTKPTNEEYVNENATAEFNDTADKTVRSRPKLTTESIFKSVGRQYKEDDVTLTDQTAQNFYYFTSEVLGNNDGGLYQLMAIPSGTFGLTIDPREESIIGAERAKSHVNLVVVKQVGSEFKPVGIDGSILTEEEMKNPDNFIRTTMHNSAALMSGSDAKIIEWAKETFETNPATKVGDKFVKKQMTDEEILSIAKTFLATKEYIQDQLAKGNNVTMAIRNKRPGITNKSDEIRGIEGIFVDQDPSSEDYKNVDLRVITVGDLGATTATIAPGSIVIFKDGFANRVLDRNLNSEEIDTVAKAIVRLNTIMGSEASKKDVAIQNEITALQAYLKGIIQWSKPNDGEEPRPQQVWFQSGLHMGPNLLTPANITEDQVKNLLTIKDSDNNRYPIYHATNRTLLKTNTEFITPIFDKEGKATFVDNIWESYTEYLLSSKNGRTAPLRTNISTDVTSVEDAKKDLTKRQTRRRNVQVTFIAPVQKEVKAVVAPKIETKVAPAPTNLLPWTETNAKVEPRVGDETAGVALQNLDDDKAGDVSEGTLPQLKDGDFVKIAYTGIEVEGKPIVYNVMMKMVDGKLVPVTKFIRTGDAAKKDLTNIPGSLEMINKVQPFSTLDVSSLDEIVSNAKNGIYKSAKVAAVRSVSLKVGQSIELAQPTPTLEVEEITDPIANIEVSTPVEPTIVITDEVNDAVDRLAATAQEEAKDRATPIIEAEEVPATVKTEETAKTPTQESKTSEEDFSDFKRGASARRGGAGTKSRTSFRISNNNTSKEDIASFEKWLNTNLPQVALTISENKIDGIAQGSFVNGMITLWRNSEVGTGFHEAFEAVWNGMLSTEQQSQMIAEFRARPEFANTNEFKWAQENYPNASEEEQVKEALAEEFRTFMLNKQAGSTNLKQGAPKRNNFFIRLWNALKSIFSKLTSTQIDSTESKIQEVFGNIASGRYAEVSMAQTFAKNYRPLKKFNVQQTAQLINGFHSEFFSALNRIAIDNPEMGLDTLLNDSDNSKVLQQVLIETRGGFTNLLNTRIQEDRANPAMIKSAERLEKIRDTITADDYFYDELWPMYKQYAKQFSLAFEKEKAKEDDEQRDSDVVDKSNLQESVEVDSRNHAKGMIKILIGSLPDLHYEDGKLVETLEEADFFAHTKTVNYGRVLNTLINDLANHVPVYVDGTKMNRIDIMFTTLDKNYMLPTGHYKRGYEWIATLKSRLGYADLKGNKIDRSNFTLAQVNLLTNFESSFSNVSESSQLLIIKEDGDMYFVDAVTEANQNKVRQNWQDNSKRPSATAITIVGGARVVDKTKLKSDNTFASRYALLASLGITPSVTEEMLAADRELEKTFNDVVARIKDTLTRDKNPITVDRLFGKQLINGPLKELSMLEVNLSEEPIIRSYRNAEGRMEYSVTLPSTGSSIINSFKFVKNIKDFFLTNPQFVNADGTVKTYQKNSFVLNKILFDSKGNRTRNQMKIYRVAGIKQEKINDGSSTKGLSFIDKVAQELNHALQARYYVIINSDKSTEKAIGFENATGQPLHFVNYETLNVDRVVNEFYIPHLVDEIMPIIQYAKDPSSVTPVQNYVEDLYKKNLGHFADKLTSFKSTINDLIKETANLEGKELEEAVLKFAQGKKRELVEYITKAMKLYQEDLMTKGIIQQKGDNYFTKFVSAEILGKFNINPKSMTKSEVDALTRFVVVNSEIAIAEQHKLIYGDPRLYKDLPKRANAANSTREIMTDNSETIEWLNRNIPRMDGKIRRTDKPTMNVMSYGDVDVMTGDLNMYAEDFYAEFTNPNRSIPMTKEKAEALIGATFDDNGKVTEFKIKKGTYLAGYAKLTENDGQGYIMADFYRDLLFASAKLSRNQMNLIDYLFAHERFTRSKWADNNPYGSEFVYKYASEEARQNDLTILKDFEANPSKYEAILPTLKPQGFTYNANTEILHTSFLKNSVTPLFFKHLESNPIGMKQYLIAQKNKVDILGSASGQKVGYIYNSTSINKNGELKGQDVDTFKNSVVNDEVPVTQEMFTEYFGLQVEMAPKTKKQILRGSQATKLVLSNIFEHGSELNTDLAQAARDYLANLQEMIAVGRQDLMDKIGLKENEDGSYETNNIEKLIKTLREEALSRDMPDNVVEIFEVDPQDVRKAKYLFDAAPTRDRIEYMLMAMIDRSVISQKISGKLSVQVASTLHTPTTERSYVYLKEENGNQTYIKVSAAEAENLSEKEKASMRMTSTDLAFYKDGRGMEVELPWYYADLLGIDENTTLSKLDPRMLQLIGYRIPTQSMGQIEYITIKRILPKELGDIIVVPTEMVGKSGSDFDIDKLSLYIPNSINGKYIAFSSKEQLEKEAIAIWAKKNKTTVAASALMDTIFGKDETQVTFVKKYYKMALENRNIELMRSLLSNPNNRRQLLTANNADTIKALETTVLTELFDKDVVDEMTDKPSKTALGQLSKMSTIRNTFIKAKQMVGIGALQITSHTIAQLSNIVLTNTERNPLDVRLAYNNNGKGQPSMAHVYSKDGKYISEILSEFLSAFVDAAKDPFIFNLNMNSDTAGTWFFLLKLSVPLDTVTFFMNQPSIRNYVTQNESEDSFVKKSNGTKKSKNAIEKEILTNLLPELKGLNGKKYQAKLEEIKESISRDIFSEETLKEALSTNKKQKLSREESLKQAAYLLEYLKYSEYADKFSNFVNSLSVDTVSAKTMAENEILMEKRINVAEERFVANPDDAFNKTFLGQMYDERTKFNSYLADKFLIANPKVRPLIFRAVKYISKKKFNSKEKVEKFMNRYQSFILSHIVQNTEVMMDGRKLRLNNGSFYEMFKGDPTTGKKSLVEQIKNNKYTSQEIANKNPFFQALALMEHGENANFDGIHLNINSMSTYDLNNAAGQINDFYEDMVTLADEDQDASDAADIVNRLVFYTLLQSGLQTSPVNFSKLIHQDLYLKFIDPIFKEFLNNNNIQLNEYNIWKQFHQNNWNNADFVETYTSNLEFIQDDYEAGYGNVFKKRGASFKPNNTFVVSADPDFNPHFITVSFIKEYDDQTGGNQQRAKQLYELMDIDNGTATYKRINMLGDKMNLMETYGKPTNALQAEDIYTVAQEIYPFVDESKNGRTMVQELFEENKLEGLVENQQVTPDNSVSLSEDNTEEINKILQEKDKGCKS